MRPKSDAEIKIMRDGGQILAGLLALAEHSAAAGMTTKELSDLVGREMTVLGAVSASKGYEGFPETICTSLNEAVVHGIPSSKVKLRTGDVLKIDITIIYKGLVVDAARTVYIGKPSSMPANIRRLIAGTERAMFAGIDAIAGAGTKVGTVSAAIQTVLEAHQLAVVRDLVGHGVGFAMHEDPNIPNYGLPERGPLLRPGMTLAIEPMATLGDWAVNILDDGWTVVTRDRSLAAHFEHTVLVTEDGAEILTTA